MRLLSVSLADILRGRLSLSLGRLGLLSLCLQPLDDPFARPTSRRCPFDVLVEHFHRCKVQVHG